MPNKTAASATTLGYMLVDVVRLLRKDFHARAIGLKVTPALARLLLHVSRTPGARLPNPRYDVEPQHGLAHLCRQRRHHQVLAGQHEQPQSLCGTQRPHSRPVVRAP